MKTPSLGTVGSLVLNVILSAWLVYQYFYDLYFRAYIDSTLGPLYPFVILTMGLGGGSGLGYLLLRRKHSGKSEVGKALTGRLMRHTTPSSASSSPSSVSQAKSLPSANAPAQPSKHTVYAVPPLAKSSVSSGQRSPSSTLWSTASRQPSGTSSVPSFQRSEPTVTAAQQPPAQLYAQPLKTDASQPGSGSKPLVEPFARPGLGSQWKPETLTSSERKPESGFTYPKPSLESVQKPNTPPLGQRPIQAAQPSPAFPTPKWQPPDTGTKPGQWTDPVPKQPAYSPPQKWAPPPGTGTAPQTRPPGVGPFRPGQPPQSRAPFPPSQGSPRPLGYPGLLRPPESGLGPGPRPLRPDQPRPTPGPGMQPRPPLQGQRSPPTQWGPAPLPASQEKREPSGVTAAQSQSPSPGTSPQPSHVSSQNEQIERKPSEDSPAGEMDWDTALDTILKTLRKDKVVDKP